VKKNSHNQLLIEEMKREKNEKGNYVHPPVPFGCVTAFNKDNVLFSRTTFSKKKKKKKIGS
jgi:hypothetical protein